MEGFAIVLIFILAICLFSVVAYLAHKARLQRQGELKALADELNMAFDPSYRRDFARYYRHFELFRRGEQGRAFNTLSGTFDIARRPFRTFMGDFTYQVSSGSGDNESTTTYHVSYIIMHTPYEGLPSLLIRPETLADKMAAAVGFDDIDFESEEFSRAFYVKSSEKRFAYDVITPQMMEFLLAGRGGQPSIDLTNGAVCLTDLTPCRWSVDDFRVRLAYLQQFFGLWPEHLLADLDSRHAPVPPDQES